MSAGEGRTGWGWLRGWRAGLVLVLLSLSVYLPGLGSIPAVDRDEARFAQASRQMFESGDWVVPRVQGRPRLNKPPLIYWLQSASARAFTGGEPLKDAIWMYRVPSLAAGVVIVLCTWRLGVAMYGPRAGVLAGALIAVSPVFFWEAHQARADMVLVACTTLAVLALWRCAASSLPGAEKGEERPRAPLGWVATLWLAVAAGVLTKGPVTPMVLFLGVAALCVTTRRWRWVLALRPVLGVALIAAMVVPWGVLVARQVGWDVFLETIRDETLGRSLEPKEGHSGFPGYHLLLLPILLFPGSVLVGLAVWEGFRARRADAAALFLLCLIAPSWLVYELIGTKLPHYTMPLYPMLAVLIARTCRAAPEQFAAWLSLGPVRWAVTAWLLALPAFIFFGLGVCAFRLPRLEALGVAGIALGLATLVLGAAAWALRRREPAWLMLVGVLAAVPALAGAAGGMHRLDELWISRRLAAHLLRLDPGRRVGIAAVGSDPQRALVGFHEDSLIFETRGRIERIAPSELDEWFMRNPGGYAVVPSAMLIRNTKYIPIVAVDGFNYSKGRRTYLCIAGARP